MGVDAQREDRRDRAEEPGERTAPPLGQRREDLVLAAQPAHAEGDEFADGRGQGGGHQGDADREPDGGADRERDGNSCGRSSVDIDVLRTQPP